MWIEGHIDTARVLVLIENFLPGLAPVNRPENSTLSVRPVHMSQRRHKRNIRIRRINNDLADGARIFQPNVLPGLAAIQRFVNSISVRDIAANARLSRP